MPNRATPLKPIPTAKAQYESDLQAYNEKQQAYELRAQRINVKIADYQRSLDLPPLIVKTPDPPVASSVDPNPDVVVVDPEPGTTVVVDDPPATVVVRDPNARVVVADPIPM